MERWAPARVFPRARKGAHQIVHTEADLRHQSSEGGGAAKASKRRMGCSRFHANQPTTRRPGAGRARQRCCRRRTVRILDPAHAERTGVLRRTRSHAHHQWRYLQRHAVRSGEGGIGPGGRGGREDHGVGGGHPVQEPAFGRGKATVRYAATRWTSQPFSSRASGMCDGASSAQGNRTRLGADPGSSSGGR